MIWKMGANAREGSTIYDGNHALLLTDLAREDPRAIRFLSEGIASSVSRIARRFGLTSQDEEELHTDVLVIFIQNIRNGNYRYEGSDPVSYAVGIAKRRVFHYSKRRLRSERAKQGLLEEEVVDPGWAGAEQVRLLADILQRLDEACRRLIHLKYLEGWSDKEAIAEQLTPYSTINALKVHRSMCMKKLSSLAKSLFDRSNL